MQRLAAAVNEKVNQMRECSRQAVKSALKHGAKVIFLGHNRHDLPVKLQVTVPDHWSSRSQEYLECTLPEGTLWKTVLWVRRNYPDAAIQIYGAPD